MLLYTAGFIFAVKGKNKTLMGVKMKKHLKSFAGILASAACLGAFATTTSMAAETYAGTFFDENGAYYGPDCDKDKNYSGAYYTELGYFAMSDEEYEAMDELDDSRYLPLLTFVCVRNGCDMSAFQNAGLDINWENSWQMATVDNYTHYLFVGREDEYLPETFVEPYGSEYLSLLQPMVDIAFHADYSAPVSPDAENVGKQLVFETTDLDGNPVSSQELFSGNEVTMINIWATWCGPCRGELPDLARINSNLESIGCGIVGLLADGQDPEDLADAKQLLQDAGVNYPVVNIPEGADDMFDLSGMPVSYFVNSDGEILADPVHGAQVDAYEQAVRNILAGNNPG